MPIRPAKKSRHYKTARHQKEDAQCLRDYVANHPRLPLQSRMAALQLADVQDRQASLTLQAIKAYGPNVVVVE